MSDGSVGRSKSPEKIKFLFLSINRVSVFTQDVPLNIQWKSLHGKPYFLFPDVLKRWSFQKNCAGIWSFLYYRERWYFFFPKIWSYTLDGKWKMIFLKKYTEIWYFLQAFWKYGLSKRCRAGTWSFLCYLERWYFFPENMIFFPWAGSERRSFSGNTWKHDGIDQRRKTENVIYRIEVWPILKFIRLEIFYNE